MDRLEFLSHSQDRRPNTSSWRREAWSFLTLFQEPCNSELEVLTHARNDIDVDTGLQSILEGHRTGFIEQPLGQADGRAADSLELVGKDIKLVVKSFLIQDSIS